MEIELLFEQAKNDLDAAQEQLSAGDFDQSIAMLASSFALVRSLLECVWMRKRSKCLDANPPGENTL